MFRWRFFMPALPAPGLKRLSEKGEFEGGFPLKNPLSTLRRRLKRGSLRGLPLQEPPFHPETTAEKGEFEGGFPFKNPLSTMDNG